MSTPFHPPRSLVYNQSAVVPPIGVPWSPCHCHCSLPTLCQGHQEAAFSTFLQYALYSPSNRNNCPQFVPPALTPNNPPQVDGHCFEVHECRQPVPTPWPVGAPSISVAATYEFLALLVLLCFSLTAFSSSQAFLVTS
jgi:hypothetical protein